MVRDGVDHRVKCAVVWVDQYTCASCTVSASYFYISFAVCDFDRNRLCAHGLCSFFHWTRFGGGGSFEIVLASLVWLQGLRLLVQVALSVIMLISPTFSALLAFAASLVGCWILINFINLFHGFNSMFTALIVMVVVGLAVVLGLVGLLSVMGPDILGLSSYV